MCFLSQGSGPAHSLSVNTKSLESKFADEADFRRDTQRILARAGQRKSPEEYRQEYGQASKVS